MNEEAQKFWFIVIGIILAVCLAVTALPMIGFVLVALFVIGCLTK